MKVDFLFQDELAATLSLESNKIVVSGESKDWAEDFLKRPLVVYENGTRRELSADKEPGEVMIHLFEVLSGSAWRATMPYWGDEDDELFSLEEKSSISKRWFGKSKVYLNPGDTPPKGVRVIQGKRGGRYYESRELENPTLTEQPKKKLVMRTISGRPIPAGWTNVWVSTDKTSKIEATGYDSKGRKQFLYSAKHSTKQAKAKFKRLLSFSRDFQSIMQKIERRLNKDEEAAILYVVSKTAFRIGGTRDTKADVKAYGVSTLLGSHVSVNGDSVRFRFIAKKGVPVDRVFKDAALARIITDRKKRDSDRLFQLEDPEIIPYLRRISGKPYLIKDFRTYSGTQAAMEFLSTLGMPEDAKQFKKMQKEIAIKVSEVLGNTPAVALSSYIAPEVFADWESHLEGKGISLRKSINKPESVEDMLTRVHYSGEDVEDWDIPETRDDPDEESEEKSSEWVEVKNSVWKPDTSSWVKNWDSKKHKVTHEEARKLGDLMNLDWRNVDIEQFRRGLEIEQEHSDLIGNDSEALAKIVLAHLEEMTDYYTKLDQMEE